MKLRIGNVELENNVTLAPMAGVTDLPFRLLCREQGCGLMCTEMVSAKALLYNNRNTKPILAVREEERPVAVQLFGSDPDIMSDMALRLEEGPYDIIDVNMGCPVPKIVNNGEGSALMKNPELAEGFLCQCGGVCQDGGELRRLCGGGSREDQGTVLFRKSGLGHYPAGEGSG